METLRFTQGDNIALVILSGAKNLANDNQNNFFYGAPFCVVIFGEGPDSVSSIV
jgi:hypothetical protein